MSVEWVVFEDASLLELSRKAFPHASPNWWSWDQFLDKCGEPLLEATTQAKLGFETALKDTPSTIGEWVATLEQLREAPLRTLDDAEYCLSHLAPTSKNHFLLRLLKLYLQSPLAQGDRMARTDRVAQHFSQIPWEHPPEKILFLKARQPCGGFEEFYRRIQEHVPASEYLETWNWNPLPQPRSRRFRRPTVIHSDATTLLNRLCEKVYSETRKGRQVQLYVEANAASQAYLQCRLAHAIGPDWRNISLAPLHPLPATKNCTSLAYCEPLPEPKGVLALEPGERFRLRVAGFAIAEVEPHSQRTQERLQAFSAPGPGHRFLFQVGDKTSLHAPPPASLSPGKQENTPEFSPCVFSATALETYQECPAKYFYSYATRLRPPISPRDSFATMFGKLTHQTLEQAFRENDWRQIQTPLLQQIFSLHLDRVVAAEGAHALPAWLATALVKRFEPVAATIPLMETKLRDAFGELRPSRFEQDFEIPFGEVTLQGRIDRIDTTPDGAALIVDYKTGNVDFSPEQVRKGTHFQALIYALAAESLFRPVGGVLFYDLKLGEIRRGLARSSQFPKADKNSLTRGHWLDEEKWETTLSAGRDHLNATIHAIQSGDFRPTPSPQTCEYCEYGTLCRSRAGWTGAMP